MEGNILEGLFDGVLIINRERRIVYANQSAKRLLGVEEGQECRGLFSICSSCPMEILEDTGGVQVYDVTTAKGSHVCWSMSPHHEGVIEIFRDVSRVISYMEEVRRQKEFVQVVLDSLVEGVLILNLEGRIVDHNQRAKDVLCREFTEIRGMHISDVIRLSMDDLPPIGERVDVYIDTPCGRRKASVLVSKLKEGEGYVVSFYLVPELLLPEGEGPTFVSKSPKFLNVLEKVKLVAELDVNVLITGETGVGKEVIARLIHQLSPRRDKPMVTINLPSIPKDLVEAELFGYEKGAFTGAVQSREGFFELAHKGTLFLDEVTEIPVEVQAKLLRAVEHKSFFRVGGRKEIRVDVRIIAATSADINKLIEEGKFRRDLYYRLNVFSIHIPPLRERKEDIPHLVNHFITKYSKLHNRKIKGVSPAVMKRFLEYDWPGNIRELENAIEHAIVVCSGTMIKEEDLPDSIRFSGLFDKHREPYNDERERIIEALRQAGGNKTLASKLLGMHRTTFWRKLKEYGLT
ncbi:sigma 54-interacting transcriptional regulator [Thermocrinis minervae]|uniref:Transcriptional regulator containing PAS, AAA-type ATPase, and DNA-binding Fis domains n=1 Tax=Thermocrinis minervae TaxID=381751 RepID=A0A1M6QR91_9AQUI|nr:sigma 54-interacting transcriptional regulator [Thermocrinis minervae]SHK22812.1 Transcriptional regulator containing PAS, AAA-type ATPase, and DNA-binding Fis domains [Thermocrinis minervae]